MIARSRLVFASVLLVSSALHLAAMTLIWIEPPVEMEGGRRLRNPRLGRILQTSRRGCNSRCRL